MKRLVEINLILAILIGMSVSIVDADSLISVGSGISLGIGNQSTVSSTEKGTSASEILKGNGTRVGYVLGHGNIIPDSEWVYIGVRKAKKNTDYVMDYSSGSLYFTEAIKTTDSVRVDYRYGGSSSGTRNVGTPGTIPLSFANNKTQAKLAFAYRAADASLGMTGVDVLTYGINSTTSFGSKSSLTSLMYVSSPEKSNRLAMSNGTLKAKQSNAAPVIEKDQINIQQANIGLGSINFKIGFEDIGEKFAGFASLRDSQAAAADYLNILEKEKGIKRNTMGMSFASGKTSGLNFSKETIKDKKDAINSNSFGYTSDNMMFSMNMREIGKNFYRFADLREGDRTQMPAEAGMSRTNYAMQMKSGINPDKSALWSSLNRTQLDSTQGSLRNDSADITLSGIRIQADIQEMDGKFNRMGALNDAERTRLASAARRQFNPEIQSGEITAQDKVQLNNEAAIDRQNYTLSFGSKMTKYYLSTSTATAKNSSIERRSFLVKNTNYSLFYNTRSIDKNFARLGSLQPTEIARNGNESGMSRSEMGGNIKLKLGDVSFNQSDVRDVTGIGIRKADASFSNQMIKFKTNMLEIDPKFNRINDLADADKALLNQEKGFSRKDFALNMYASKFLNIDTYNLKSTSTSAGQTRNQNKYLITYAPNKGPQIQYLSDQYSYNSQKGILSSYDHTKLNFANTFNFLGGLQFKGMQDINTTIQDISGPVTSTVNQYHLETNQQIANSVFYDNYDADYGLNRTEKTQAIGVKSRLFRGFSLTGGYSTTKIWTAKKDEQNIVVGADWAINGNLKLNFNVANRLDGNKGTQKSRQFGINGLLAKRFMGFDNITVGSAVNTNELKGKQNLCNNKFKLQAGFMGGSVLVDNSDSLNPQKGIYYTSRIIKFESDKSPNKLINLTYFRQDLKNPDGKNAKKRNYSFGINLSNKTSIKYLAEFGRDAQNGFVQPIGSNSIKLNTIIGKDKLIGVDYNVELNDITRRYAHTVGLGINGKFDAKTDYEFYYGWTHLREDKFTEDRNVYRCKFDRQLSADNFITLSAVKRSGVERSLINPDEGNTMFRVDFRTLFN